jgi:apolipoprotein N-acyltransferase
VTRAALVAACGALAVLGYAPLAWWPLMPLSLAALAWCVRDARRTRDAAWLGFAWGFAHFACGVGWLRIALSTFGGMPMPLAIFAVGLLVAYMALFPAAACALAARVLPRSRLVALPAAWVLTEWTRLWLFTGFPWASVGYSQVPASPLAGFAPVGGLFLVSGATVAVACAGVALALAVARTPPRDGTSTPGGTVRPHTRRVRPAVLLVATVAGGAALGAFPWTAGTGRPVTVSLVQGNVEQSLKFTEDGWRRTVAGYLDAVARARGQLIVLPETALPVLRHELPAELLERFAKPVRARGADLLLGVFENDPPGSDRYFNSVITLGSAPEQRYRKHHLVPFGEFIPLKALLAPIVDAVLHIPLSDQTRGESHQRPLDVAGERIGMAICYEDVFGEEVIRALPAATLLVNVSNDAWYGRSWAAEQHRQIAQMRALETGRPMLRATNTGVTAAIDHRGDVVAELPQFTAGTLETIVEGRTGATPYVRFGNAPVVIVAALWLGLLLARRRAAPVRLASR